MGAEAGIGTGAGAETGGTGCAVGWNMNGEFPGWAGATLEMVCMGVLIGSGRGVGFCNMGGRTGVVGLGCAGGCDWGC